MLHASFSSVSGYFLSFGFFLEQLVEREHFSLVAAFRNSVTRLCAVSPSVIFQSLGVGGPTNLGTVHRPPTLPAFVVVSALRKFGLIDNVACFWLIDRWGGWLGFGVFVSLVFEGGLFVLFALNNYLLRS